MYKYIDIKIHEFTRPTWINFSKQRQIEKYKKNVKYKQKIVM